MTVSLGLDIGSNSVGSAWVDTDAKEIVMGVSVFPAGVDESETKRGSPKNQRRREKRSLRRNVRRRAKRRRRLRELLVSAGLLPADPEERKELMKQNPWELRRRALTESLTPLQFGRILVHLNQRRGALGVHTNPEDNGEGKVKDAIDELRAAMDEAGAETFGQFMADLMHKRRHPIPNKCNFGTPPASCPPNCQKEDEHCSYYRDPVRNRRDSFEFHATRSLIRDEFTRLWDKQKSLGGELAPLLTDELRTQLHESNGDDTWRQRGAIFGQRRTYWNLGTLGRCDLEPTDRCCPLADRHAQEFRVLETVNNIRIEERDKAPRALTPEERTKVIAALRAQKSASVATIRRALGLNKKAVKDFFSLNIERDKDRAINTDWFWREIVRAVFGEEAWAAMDDAKRESVNRALLKFNPEIPDHVRRLQAGAVEWWGLAPHQAEKLAEAWKARPRLEQRLNLSRRAILNLVPYMREWGCSVTEAKKLFAEDGENGATPEQRERYALGGSILTKADRRFLRKHPDLLPPAPKLSNPVVRKAIHEVRRHVMAHMRRSGRKPDRVVIELAKSARQTEKVRNKILSANRRREKEKKGIIAEFGLAGLPLNHQRAAVERIRLCRQQNGVCPYSNLKPGVKGEVITDDQAKDGKDVEVDHIIPLSRSQDNFLSNKVLCRRRANRGKGNRTPEEWLPPEQFALLEQRMAHWKKECPRKWENLHRKPQPEKEFLASQLTATSYAAKQVGGYLSDAVYGAERDGRRQVFFTKGGYTAMLRKDWQLFQTLRQPDDASAKQAKQTEEVGKKNRADHRHHAIDALIVALTGPEIIQDVARVAAEREEYHERTGHWPKRVPLPPPWGDVNDFRRQVLSQLFGVFDRGNPDGTRAERPETGTPLIVSHRPAKRRLVGPFHEETLYGPVLQPDRLVSDHLFSKRIPASRLTPNHLRMPQDSDGLERELAEAGFPSPEHRRRWRPTWRRLCQRQDPPPTKSGIVRDLGLRFELRQSLRKAGLDPDNFSPKDLKELLAKRPLRRSSGVPVKSIVLLRTLNDPVIIERKVWDPSSCKERVDPDPRTRRAYIGGNNHHVEIREDPDGHWSGETVTTYEAARRVRRSGRKAVNRSDTRDGTFVISLAEGETVHMKHPKTGAPGYFVVFKLDKPRTIWLTHHWDARPSKGTDQQEAREEMRVAAPGLRALEPQPGQPPYKVRVSPLGEVTPLHHD